MPGVTNVAVGTFEKYVATDVSKLHGRFGVSTYGACTVYNFKDWSSSFDEIAGEAGLDAGPQLTLTRPSGRRETLVEDTSGKGAYFTSLGSFPVPGTYTITNGNGSTDVLGFSASITVPQMVTWTNVPQLFTTPEISRNAGVSVTWKGGDPEDAIVVAGESSLEDGTGAGFYCLARDTDGQFTVPPDVLSALPSSLYGGLGIAEIPTKSKFVVSNPPQGVDVLTFTYQLQVEATVGYL